MSIYRGAGGSGDAIADSSSEALLVRELAVEVQADADAAAASATAASGSASSASSSASAAATSATNAASSATSAASSASSASTSATNAATSATAAQTAETAAELAETNAETAETNAAASASSASTSASTATTQATNASNSASAAATSETNAASSASSASTSATNAASSATSASGSATSASSSASSASTSATNAASSATSAASSATTATTQAGIATTKASEAATSATNAASSASSASTSASNAATSATAASGSASTASTAATNASNSASAAATSATNAANSATDAATSASNAAATLSNALVKTNNLSDLTSALTARTNLGLGTIATQNANNVNLTGGSISGITDLAVADGGTGASTAADARTNLDAQQTLASGTNIKTINGSSVLGSGNLLINTGMKNRIINGAMVIDQRNAGASVNNSSGNLYTIDRWQANGDQAAKFSIQQNAGSVTPPAGFTNYLGITSLSSYSVPSAEAYQIRQKVEGFNIADLAWGTASAKPITISFFVRSSLTGTFGGSIQNSAGNRSYPFTYTISSANTWEQKSITITGDTSGTWLTTNGIGLRLQFGLGVGSTYSGTAGSWSGNDFISATGATSVVGTNGATFYITGVQLEVGSSATGFEYRQYGQELALCQRYYEKFFNQGTAPVNGIASGNGAFNSVALSASDIRVTPIYFKVVKRTSPTITYYNTDVGSGGNWAYFTGSWNTNSSTATETVGENAFTVICGVSGRTFGQALYMSGNWTASAEL